MKKIIKKNIILLILFALARVIKIRITEGIILFSNDPSCFGDITVKVEHCSIYFGFSCSRTLTKTLTAILRPFLESSRCQKKKFSRTLTKHLTAILRPFLNSSRFFEESLLRILIKFPTDSDSNTSFGKYSIFLEENKKNQQTRPIKKKSINAFNHN